jgi:hypothetical protein
MSDVLDEKRKRALRLSMLNNKFKTKNAKQQVEESESDER